MVAFGGRTEALIKVPAGGAPVSVSSGALTSSVTVTLPAGDYFHSAAGGVDSLIDEFETAINAAVSPYPDNAASMAAAIGYVTWSAGWSFQIASGNDTGMFGGVTMTAAGTPAYRSPGPAHGTDYAVTFDSAADGFNAGNNYDVNGTSDVAIATVVKFSSVAANADLIGKGFAGAVYYELYLQPGLLVFQCGDGVDAAGASVPVTTDVWYAVLAVLERASNTLRLAVCPLGGSPSVSPNTSTTLIGSLSNASNFLVGAGGGYGSATAQVAAVYVAAGVGAATGLTTNISAATQNFASAVASAFTVSLDTTSTGRMTIANSFWPCSVAFTSTNLRDVLGYAYDFEYPQTAAQMATALGYGTWTGGAGYLLNESATPLVPAFGSPNLTAVSTPTYSNQGARGGTDKAVGFDSGADGLTGGDVFDVGASDDLIILWVAKNTAALASAEFVTKYPGATPYWYFRLNGNNYDLAIDDGAGQKTSGVTSMPAAGTWHVGMTVIDRGASQIRTGWRSLMDSTSAVSTATSIAGVGTLANAASMRIGDSANGFNAAPTTYQISAFYIVAGSGVATGLSANLSAALSSFAAYMKSQTGTEQARGLWIPGDLVSMDSDPRRAPTMSDARRTMSPIGQVLTLVGNTYKKHTNVVYPYVTIDRVWAAEATYENGSWEEFVLETQLGQGSSWFTPGSAIQIYDHNNVQVGVDANVAGWYMVGVDDVNPRKSEGVGEYTGLWRIEIPMLIAVGS